MHAILSSDRKSVRTSRKTKVLFQEGDMAFDNHDIGSADIRLMSSSERNTFGVFPVKRFTWDKYRYSGSVTGFEKTQAGYIKTTDGVVVETGTVSEISASRAISRLRGSVDGKKQNIGSAGVLWSLGMAQYIVQTDPESRELLAGAVAMVNEGAWDDVSDFWTVREVVVVGETKYVGATVDLVLTGAEIKELGVAVGQHVKSTHGAARAHKAAIDALSTWAEYDAYDLNGGWPEVPPTEAAPE